MNEPLRLIVWPGMPDTEGLAIAAGRIGRELDVSVISSNEDLEDLLENDGPFDLITPSDYLVEKLVGLGRLADIAGAEGIERDRLAEWSRCPSYDPEERFSVPLAFGTTGVLFAAGQVTEPVTWTDFFDPRGLRAGVLGEVREAVGAALILTGHSPNATDETALADAECLLMRQLPAVDSVTSDDFVGPVERGDVAMHQAWSGPAAMAMRRSPGLRYSVPVEGALLWVTTAAVPADARDPQGALRLLRELMDPEIAAMAVSNGGYSTPNKPARGLLPSDLEEDEVLFPPTSTIERCLSLEALDPSEEQALETLWARYLAAQSVTAAERAVDSRT